LARLTDEDAEAIRHDWSIWARPTQLPPKLSQNGMPDWVIWLYLAGRGSGKTRALSEWVRERVKQGHTPIHLIAPTQGDARKVNIEGPSGILSVSWELDHTDKGELMGIPDFQPSLMKLTWKNGAELYYFSAEEADRLRGPQCASLVCDELAAWKSLEDTWDMAMFGFRLGTNPQCMIATTPKPIAKIRELVADKGTAITRDTTYANRENLAKAFFKQVVSKYEGTRLGRQELRGEILEDVEGALWRRDMIRYEDDVRGKPRLDMSPGNRRIVWSNGSYSPLLRVGVGVDPQTANNENSAETGIIGFGVTLDGQGFVIADRSGRKTPREWATTVVALYDELEADLIVAEKNQGGEMVAHTIWSVRSNLPVELVHASRAKQARAEPVAALYEKEMIYHLQHFEELEDSYCVWEPMTGMPSPDRLDAAVWIISKLMVAQGELILPVADEMIHAR